MMTADEIVDHAPAIDEPTVQYDKARRGHELEALLAHVADRHQDWLDAREAEAIVKRFGGSEIRPSKTDPTL